MRLLLGILGSIVTVLPCAASDELVDYSRDIRPIFSSHCFACHGPDKSAREGGFRLDDKVSAFGEADSGAHPIVSGRPDMSEVVTRITSDDVDVQMPPAESTERLTPDQIQLVRRWIEQGATWEKHWSFVTPERPALPKTRNITWRSSPIDDFILARLETEGLAPSPQADKETLIRRVTFDLTGLPPTLAEVDKFLSDDSLEAYERVVDGLLESLHYGEHMARFWLDAVRYGDTHGLHLDNYREIWPYRDWVVQALNDNMPFDQFTTEQLAGDLLDNPTRDQLVASGFNRCNISTSEGGAIREEWYVRNVVDRVVTASTVFMGLTMDCTRCHDHKYDPMTMDDFYSLFAFFNSIDGGPLDSNAKDHKPILRLPNDEQKQQLQELSTQIDMSQRKTLEPWPEVDAEQLAWVKTLLESADQPSQKTKEAGDDAPEIPAEIIEIVRIAVDEQSQDQKAKLQSFYREKISTVAALQEEQARLADLRKAHAELEKQVPLTLIWRELAEPRTAYYLHRGEYDQHGHVVQRRTPGFLPPMEDDMPRDRLGLAQWLVDRKHPLTARVMVNRLWQQIMGTGLVKTSEDFGAQGEPPSHQELLDWLAVEFIEDGWNVKQLMKRLVMSSTYRQSSQLLPGLYQRDPENRLYARGPRYRLDAEMLRDQALFVSGLLVQRLGGPSVKPPQPDGLWFAVGYTASNTARFVADTGPDKVHRRTLYTFLKRTAPPPQMSIVDAPSREACTVRRERTNTPLIALMLQNDPQYVEAARALADRVLRKTDPEPSSRATMMFRLCTARQPTTDEVNDLVEGVRVELRHYELHPEEAAKLIAIGEVPPYEGHSSVELAAWTMIANMLLCTDEVVTKN